MIKNNMRDNGERVILTVRFIIVFFCRRIAPESKGKFLGLDHPDSFFLFSRCMKRLSLKGSSRGPTPLAHDVFALGGDLIISSLLPCCLLRSRLFVHFVYTIPAASVVSFWHCAALLHSFQTVCRPINQHPSADFSLLPTIRELSSH